jgi:hypothetical protein
MIWRNVRLRNRYLRFAIRTELTPQIRSRMVDNCVGESRYVTRYKVAGFTVINLCGKLRP